MMVVFFSNLKSITDPSRFGIPTVVILDILFHCFLPRLETTIIFMISSDFSGKCLFRCWIAGPKTMISVTLPYIV